MVHTVLVTGASGLLGRAIYKAFKNHEDWKSIGIAFSRAKEDLLKVDLTKKEEIVALFQKFQPDIVIHSAAERRPDVVENKVKETHLLNIEGTGYLCEQAVHLGIPLIYMSTDYVFDGKNPPYKETDKPNPLNKYGQSKLDGEKVVLQSSACNLVLRVPILYGPVENLKESAVTVLYEDIKCKTQSCVMSDYERRFPTHVDDVASILMQIATKKLQVDNINGILQFSGQENLTKYGMAQAIAETLNTSIDHVTPNMKPSTSATRPYNSELDISKLEQLGIFVNQRSFKDSIGECLKPHV